MLTTEPGHMKDFAFTQKIFYTRQFNFSGIDL